MDSRHLPVQNRVEAVIKKGAVVLNLADPLMNGIELSDVLVKGFKPVVKPFFCFIQQNIRRVKTAEIHRHDISLHAVVKIIQTTLEAAQRAKYICGIETAIEECFRAVEAEGIGFYFIHHEGNGRILDLCFLKDGIGNPGIHFLRQRILPDMTPGFILRLTLPMCKNAEETKHENRSADCRKPVKMHVEKRILDKLR